MASSRGGGVAHPLHPPPKPAPAPAFSHKLGPSEYWYAPIYLHW